MMEMLWIVLSLVWFIFWLHLAWKKAYHEFSGWTLCKEVILDIYAVLVDGDPEEVIVWGGRELCY